VSLTVASLDDEGFDVQLVPHTLSRTNLTSAARAAALNVEVDILGKYVAKMLEGHLRDSAPGAAANGADAGGLAAGLRFIEPVGGSR
jgi:riboflavin synthase